MSKVIFIEDRNFAKVRNALEKFGIKKFSGKEVMVKLHMGELGNRAFLKPEVVKIFVDALKIFWAKPFLFDTITRHPSRCTKEKYFDTAMNKHGFQKVGCDIVIGDEGQKVKIENFEFEVAKEFAEAENILVLSHAKGHMCVGFGGAIKNLGMGTASLKCKMEMHELGKPVIDYNLCMKCKTCVGICPVNVIKVDEKWSFDKNRCLGCGKCVDVCPSNALKNKADLQESLARMTKACIKNTKNKKMIYVNIMTNITKWCDCTNNEIFPYEILCDDIGILISDDPVAIDAAAIDLIEQKMKKSFVDVWNIDARRQVKKAEQLGMGSMKYDLVRTDE
jgi:hypothetical protein